MNIKSVVQGGKVISTATIDGKRRQMTVQADPNKSNDRNAGSGAGQFAAKHFDQATQRRMDDSILRGEVKWFRVGKTYTFPFNIEN